MYALQINLTHRPLDGVKVSDCGACFLDSNLRDGHQWKIFLGD